MNTTIQILDWVDSHKVGTWASFITVVYAVEHAGGLRTIWARILGPKQPSGNPGELPADAFDKWANIRATLPQPISGPQPAPGAAETKKETTV